MTGRADLRCWRIAIARGHLQLPRELHDALFPAASSVGLLARELDMLVIPLVGSTAGGMLLKRRNGRGDCAVDANEFLHRHCVADDAASRELDAYWDENLGALVVPALLAAAAAMTHTGSVS